MMTRSRLLAFAALALAAAGVSCSLKRPDIAPTRMIEPRLPDAAGPVADAGNAADVRLLETQARGHLGRRVLHQLAGGELTEDPIWRWTTSPDRYLDSALRLAIAARPDVRVVDTSTAPALAITLLAWHLEATTNHALVGAIEVQVIRPDRTSNTEVIRGQESVSTELPGDLAEAAGRLLQRLATESLTRVTQSKK